MKQYIFINAILRSGDPIPEELGTYLMETEHEGLWLLDTVVEVDKEGQATLKPCAGYGEDTYFRHGLVLYQYDAEKGHLVTVETYVQIEDIINPIEVDPESGEPILPEKDGHYLVRKAVDSSEINSIIKVYTDDEGRAWEEETPSKEDVYVVGVWGYTYDAQTKRFSKAPVIIKHLQDILSYDSDKKEFQRSPVFFPLTHVRAVIDSEGNNLGSMLGRLQDNIDAAIVYLKRYAESLAKEGSAVDDVTIRYNGDNKLELKDGGITAIKLSEDLKESIEHAGKVDGESLVKDADTGEISINEGGVTLAMLSAEVKTSIEEAGTPDEVTITKDADTKEMSVKDGGISAAKLGDVVDGTTIEKGAADQKLGVKDGSITEAKLDTNLSGRLDDIEDSISDINDDLDDIKDDLDTKLNKPTGTVTGGTIPVFTEDGKGLISTGFDESYYAPQYIVGDLDELETEEKNEIVAAINEVVEEIAELPRTSPIDVEASGNYADLDISDEDGNVIARFKNGHIQTKKFDSENLDIEHPVSVDDSGNNSDLDLSDEDGNVIARFKNGHIQTKKFDSENFRNTFDKTQDPRNYGAVYDGVSPCSSAIQQCLNKGGTIIFCGNGIALIDTPLIINKSNTHIVASKNFTFKLANGVNAAMLYTLGGQYLATDSRVDTERLYNISITGGVWDCNGAMQTRTGEGYMSTVGWRIADIDNLSVNSVTIKNPNAFGIYAGGLNNFIFRDIYLDYYTFTNPNMDGIHLAGNIFNGVIDNVYGITHDDFVALNVDGDFWGDIPNNQLRVGNANNIVVRNIHSDGDGYRAIRIMSGVNYKPTNILVDGVFGRFLNKGPILLGAWRADSYIGNISLRNIFCQAESFSIVQLGEDSATQYKVVVDKLDISGVSIKMDAYNNVPFIKMVNSTSTIKSLSINDMFLDYSDVIQSEPIMSGKINKAILDNIEIVGNIESVITSDSSCLVISNAIVKATQLYGISNPDAVIKESNIINLV